jgi:hypothetical protein
MRVFAAAEIERLIDPRSLVEALRLAFQEAAYVRRGSLWPCPGKLSSASVSSCRLSTVAALVRSKW